MPEICYAIRHASETYMKDIIGYTTDQVVSTDLIGNPCPCIFDETARHHAGSRLRQAHRQVR